VSDRWVVLGLAPARSEWFRRLASWATAGTLPIELLRCQSVPELRARRASTRPVSAALIDATVPGLDRDLLDNGPDGCPVLVIDAVGSRRWIELGAAGVLAPDLDPMALLDALAAVAHPVGDALDVPGELGPSRTTVLSGRLVAVCGAGGSGASTAALALGQGLGHGHGGTWLPGPVVVADLCRRGDLAMLHDIRDLLVGVQELVDAHRATRPDPVQVRSMCVPVNARAYDLLLGLRQPRAWTALRPRAVTAAIEGLRVAYATVVADIEPEVEGEAETGSADVEERHALARTALLRADLVLTVGSPGVHGIHALVRTVREIVDGGVDPRRVLPVVNRGPRGAGAKAEITAAVAGLCSTDAGSPAPVLFLPTRRVEESLLAGAPLPGALAAALAHAAAAVVARMPQVDLADTDTPRPVRPGSLGTVEETW